MTKKKTRFENYIKNSFSIGLKKYDWYSRVEAGCVRETKNGLEYDFRMSVPSELDETVQLVGAIKRPSGDGFVDIFLPQGAPRPEPKLKRIAAQRSMQRQPS